MRTRTSECGMRRAACAWLAVGLAAAGLDRGASANPIPLTPPASMPLEEMYVQIQRSGEALHAVFTGDYTFDPWFFNLGYGQAGGQGAPQELALGCINIGPGVWATFPVQLGYCKATVVKTEYDHNTPVWPAVEEVLEANLIKSSPIFVRRLGAPVAIESVKTMADHGPAPARSAWRWTLRQRPAATSRPSPATRGSASS